MQRSRFGQILVTVSLLCAAMAMVIIGITSMTLSEQVVTDAAPDLFGIERAREQFVAELVRVLPQGSVDLADRPGETLVAVANRTARDSALIDDVQRAATDAHRAWRAGQRPVLHLDPEVVTPAVLAALRDLDLDLARTFPASAVISPGPVATPVATTAAAVESLRGTALVGLLVSLAGLCVGAVVLARLDHLLHTTGRALMVLAGLALAVTIALPAIDVGSIGWAVPAMASLIGAARTELLLAVVAALLIGWFLRAVANQIAPLVERRVDLRRRSAAGPLPAASGAHTSRRRGRGVRQQAIDAFFEKGDEASAPDVIHMEEPPLVAYDGDGFEDTLVAVERDSPTPDAGDDDRSIGAAEDRREALERIDGARSRLRTHLPR
ncbi:MAG: hypothetical protein JJE52_11800 [Acidimicrobiia bacterium]|nr:hypothetical protein [Acidimicrobiia bacterium]